MRIYFISGLPRSGSTMLAAILRQNPQIRAGMSSPLRAMFAALRNSMGPSNEFAFGVTDEQRARVLRSLVESFYADAAEHQVIFDANRGWCGLLPAIVRLFPESRLICCVRNLAWVLDSFEQLVQNSSLRVSKMFPSHSGASEENQPGNVVGRVELLMKHQVGACLNGLRQAWFGEYARHLVAIRYESLAADPETVISSLYTRFGLSPFDHDYDHLQYEETSFDESLGIPGLHSVRAKVELRERSTILPPDLFAEYNRAFWDMPGQNPRGVVIL